MRLRYPFLCLRGFAAVAALFAVALGAARAEVQVAATTPSLAAIAAEVGGPRVRVTALSQASEDPHFVDARPSLIITLNQADLLLATGLELEVGWLPALQRAARNPKIAPGGEAFVEAAAFVTLLGAPASVDRAQGDVHPGGNPHFLLDPRAGARVAVGVGEALARVDPEGGADYRARARALAERLDGLAARLATSVRALPEDRRRVVVYHDSFPYVLDWLGLTQVITVEPRPGIAPDPGHVARVLAAMRGQGAKVLLQEAYYPRNTSETVARLAPARLVVLPAGPEFATGETYEAFVSGLGEAIHAALGG